MKYKSMIHYLRTTLFYNSNSAVLLLAIIKGMITILAPLFIMNEFPSNPQLLGYISIYFSIAYLLGSISASILADKIRNYAIGLLQVISCVTCYMLIVKTGNLFVIYSIFVIGFLTLSEMQTYSFHFYQKNYVQDMHQGLSRLEAQWQIGAFGAGIILLILSLFPLNCGFVTFAIVLVIQSIFFWRWKKTWPKFTMDNSQQSMHSKSHSKLALLKLNNIIDSSVSVIPLLLSQILYIIFPIITYSISHRYQQFYFTLADKVCVVAGIFAALAAHLFQHKLTRNFILSMIEITALILLVIYFQQSVILLFMVAALSSFAIYVHKINLIALVYNNTADNNFKHNYALRAILKTVLLLIIGIITSHIADNLLLKLLMIYTLLVSLLIIYLTIYYYRIRMNK